MKKESKPYLTTATVKKMMKESSRLYKQTDEYKSKSKERTKRMTESTSFKNRQAKRKRGMGFNPLNRPFFGSVGHHINNNDIIHMPEEIHRAIPHCVSTGQNMNMINQIAVLYLNKETFKLEF